MKVKTRYDIVPNDDPNFFPRLEDGVVILRNGERLPYVFCSSDDARHHIKQTTYEMTDGDWTSVTFEEKKDINTVGDLREAISQFDVESRVWYQDSDFIRKVNVFESKMGVFFDNEGVTQFIKES